MLVVDSASILYILKSPDESEQRSNISPDNTSELSDPAQQGAPGTGQEGGENAGGGPGASPNMTILERDEKLSELDERADALQAGAQVFESSAAALKRKYWWKNCKMMIMLGVICAIVVIAIAQSICLPIPILFPLCGEMMEENRNGVPIFFGQFSSYFGGTMLMEVQHLKRSRGTRANQSDGTMDGCIVAKELEKVL
ncbi:Vesicle-associated membrane protein 1, partial [Ophiophagus hannah]